MPGKITAAVVPGTLASCGVGRKVTAVPKPQPLDVDRELPSDVDPALWFACSTNPGGRDYLVANAHTFTGRMLAFCPRKPGSPFYYVSASEVRAECSDAARYWVAGFLAGKEPAPPRDDDDDLLPSDDPRLVAWRADCAEFARTGQWPQR